MKKIKKLLKHIYKKIFDKKIVFLKPCSKVLSKDSQLLVKNHLRFNLDYGKTRTAKNKNAGVFVLEREAKMEVGSFDFMAGCRVVVNKNAVLTIGSGYMNYNSIIECFNKIEIGENCFISEQVYIRDNDGHSIKRDGYQSSMPIKIGNHVWVGVRATILKGVTIGDGAIIAAGSIVNRDVPSRTLVAGNPARVVRTDVEWV